MCYNYSMAKQAKQTKKKRLHIELVRQMIVLSTTGFGLVAALAWNSLIQEFVKNYIEIFFPKGSGIISLLIYAVVITVLAVFVTLQLTTLLEKLEE